MYNQSFVDDYIISSKAALSGENFATGLNSALLSDGLHMFSSTPNVTNVVVGVGSPTASPTAFQINSNPTGSASNNSGVNYDLLALLVIPIVGTAAIIYWLYSHVKARRAEEAENQEMVEAHV